MTIKTMSQSRVARQLNLSDRTVRRYSKGGRLQSLRTKRGRQILQEAVLREKNGKAALESVESHIKFIYACKATGVELEFLKWYAHIDELNVLQTALDHYRRKRGRLMEGYGVPSYLFEELLMSTEVMERLKMKSPHIISKLFARGSLKSPEKTRYNGNRRVITIDSLCEYLGDYAPHILYTSETIGNKLGKTRQQVTRLAKSRQVGFKLMDTPQSPRLFSSYDIQSLKARRKTNRNRQYKENA